VARHRSTRRLPARTAAALIATLAVTLVAAPSASSAAPKIDVDQAQRQVDALYQQAEQATERYDVARNAMQDAERKLAQAQSRATAQQSVVTDLQRTVGDFAASAYRAGGLDQTLQLVFSNDPAAFIDKAASLDALSTREAAALRKVVEARRELRAGQVAAAQQLAIIDAQRRVLATEKSTIERRLRQARAVLSALQASDRAKVERASRGLSGRALLASLPIPTNRQALAAVQFGIAHLGDRYVWSAVGPRAWDCSGLTMMAWRAAGVSLPHSSAEQFATGQKIARSQLTPGDLVFFYRPISHVGIYLGNGQMVHAPNPSRPVEVAPIDRMPWAGATRP
jgi:peptidoglycan DL-endopeptidase CwlO